MSNGGGQVLALGRQGLLLGGGGRGLRKPFLKLLMPVGGVLGGGLCFLVRQQAQ